MCKQLCLVPQFNDFLVEVRTCPGKLFKQVTCLDQDYILNVLILFLTAN